MRPRHKVAIYCSDKERRSSLRLVLWLHGFEILSARKLAGIPTVLWGDMRCALIVRTASEDGSIAFAGLCETVSLPFVFLDEGLVPILVTRSACGVKEIIDLVKNACARKRGPKVGRTVPRLDVYA